MSQNTLYYFERKDTKTQRHKDYYKLSGFASLRLCVQKYNFLNNVN